MNFFVDCKAHFIIGCRVLTAYRHDDRLSADSVQLGYVLSQFPCLIMSRVGAGGIRVRVLRTQTFHSREQLLVQHERSAKLITDYFRAVS